MFAQTNQSKFVPISGGAMAATFGLFYLMQGLVASDELEFREMRDPWRLQVNIGDLKVEPARQIERVTPPPEVEPEPVIEVDRSMSFKGVDFKIGPAPVPQIHSSGSEKLDLGLSDGQRMPLVRVQPIYPRRALERGVEGWVVLQFTVSEHGTVEDPVVVDAEPKGFFEKAAIDAIRKYKYKPTVVDGQARATQGEQFRMVFELADNG